MSSAWLRPLAALGVGLLGTAALLAMATKPPPEEMPLLWWTARASGLLAYQLLTLGMMFGLLVSWRGLIGAIGQRRAFALHDQLSLVAVVASGLHAVAVVGVVVTGARGWSLLSPLPTTLGLLALTGLILLFAMRWLTRRLSPERWRLVHRAAFLVYLAALGHAATAGIGLVESHARWIYVLVGALMIGAWIFRGVFHVHGGVSSARLPLAENASDRVLGAVEAARRTGAEVLLTLVQGRDGGPLQADKIALFLKHQPHGRSEVVEIEDNLLGILRLGHGIAQAATSLAEALRLECGMEACAGSAVYPTDAWDADGLRRVALMRLNLDRYQPELVLAGPHVSPEVAGE